MSTLMDSLRCKGLCHDRCSIAPMSATELAALQVAAGRTFDVYPAPFGLVDAFTITPPGSLRCPALTDDNRCIGYAGRPAICRLYGMVERMPCEHGCRPTRWLTDQEAAQLLRAGWEVPV